MEASAAQDATGLPQPPVQANECLDHPAFTKGKVSKPMIEKIAGEGIYYRVSIISELRDRIEVFYPACEGDAAYSEWLWRTSSRIHRPGSGKWSYVSRGGWRFNVKASKKRGRGKGIDSKGIGQLARNTSAEASREPEAATISHELSASECSHATTSSGCKPGHAASSAVAIWFEAHLRARRNLALQEGDRLVASGPAMPAAGVRSQLRSSADVQSKSSAWSCEDATSVRRHDDHDSFMQPPPAKMQAHAAPQNQHPVTSAAPSTHGHVPTWHATAAASPTAEPRLQQQSGTVCSPKWQSQLQHAQSPLAVHGAPDKGAGTAAVCLAECKTMEHDGHDSAPEHDSRRSSSTVENHSSADEQAVCNAVEA